MEVHSQQEITDQFMDRSNRIDYQLSVRERSSKN